MCWAKLLAESDLKNLPAQLSRRDRVLAVLASFDTPCQIKELISRARNSGHRIHGWKPSTILSRAGPLAINTPVGWEISEQGKSHLHNLGLSGKNPAANRVAADLGNQVALIKSSEIRAFAKEAIACFGSGYYRSAVVMSWLGAMSVLQHHVVEQHLPEFNNEARRRDAKWKDAKTPDDLGRMKEWDFLVCLTAISVLGKSVKDELQQCLKRRNGCGHPNSYKIGENYTRKPQKHA